jgi:antitoxin YefM
MAKPYNFNTNVHIEEDNSITISLNEIDIVVNGSRFDKAMDILADDLVGYANDNCKDFDYWYSAPNRIDHLPYVMIILNQVHKEAIKKLIFIKQPI